MIAKKSNHIIDYKNPKQEYLLCKSNARWQNTGPSLSRHQMASARESRDPTSLASATRSAHWSSRASLPVNTNRNSTKFAQNKTLPKSDASGMNSRKKPTFRIGIASDQGDALLASRIEEPWSGLLLVSTGGLGRWFSSGFQASADEQDHDIKRPKGGGI